MLYSLFVSMAGYQGTYDSLDELLKKDQEWNCQLMLNQSDPGEDVDFVDLIKLVHTHASHQCHLKKLSYPAGT